MLHLLLTSAYYILVYIIYIIQSYKEKNNGKLVVHLGAVYRLAPFLIHKNKHNKGFMLVFVVYCADIAKPIAFSPK